MPGVDLDTLCPGCMRPLEAAGQPCPHCGWDPSRRNDANQLAIGSVLGGRYLIGRALGQGGFGITYIGWDIPEERRVAIKEYYPADSVTRQPDHYTVAAFGDAEAVDHFAQGRSKFFDEASRLARFQTVPGIVRVLAAFMENGTAYIVMEYVEGQTFKQYLKGLAQPMPLTQVLALLRPVTDALGSMHAAGIIHRDISPDNIMITPAGGAKLLDFGAARSFAKSSQQGYTVNIKSGYAPEEQYRTTGEQGPWSDVYALSATIYRAITGQVPVQPFDRVRTDTLVAPHALGAHLTPQQEAALLRGLALYGRDRYQSVQELVDALCGVQPAGEPVTVLPAGEDVGVTRSVPHTAAAPGQPTAALPHTAPQGDAPWAEIKNNWADERAGGAGKAPAGALTRRGGRTFGMGLAALLALLCGDAARLLLLADSVLRLRLINRPSFLAVSSAELILCAAVLLVLVNALLLPGCMALLKRGALSKRANTAARFGLALALPLAILDDALLLWRMPNARLMDSSVARSLFFEIGLLVAVQLVLYFAAVILLGVGLYGRPKHAFLFCAAFAAAVLTAAVLALALMGYGVPNLLSSVIAGNMPSRYAQFRIPVSFALALLGVQLCGLALLATGLYRMLSRFALILHTALHTACGVAACVLVGTMERTLLWSIHWELVPVWVWVCFGFGSLACALGLGLAFLQAKKGV